MEGIGAEVGQKMRSAIKAKLMELSCYVDDELPDYIMVMVANRRSKSQMNEDLQLFLASKTETFVDWLHIVLKKLKEVTVTNPEVYKKVAAKRKNDDSPKDVKVKKEKKDKTKQKKSKKKEDIKAEKSLTDDLPININALAGKRKVVIMQENRSSNVNEDNFDIPPLSAVQLSTTESELADIERQIKNVKSRLGLIVESDSDDADFINLKAEPDELFTNESLEDKQKESRKIQIVPPQALQQKRTERARITFNTDDSTIASKKKSILERLGKRRFDSVVNETESFVKRNRSNSEENDETGSGRLVSVVKKPETATKARESVLSRLGVMSKVLVPEKLPEEEPPPLKEVPSVVKVKPRVIPPGTKQANKNLLLKAVAEAQRSVSQTPSVGNNLKPDALFTKRYKEKLVEQKKSVSEAVSNIVVHVKRSEEAGKENVPKSVKDRLEPSLEYVPTINPPETSVADQKFIITLDGVENRNRKPSPIIFDKAPVSVKRKINVPDHLPLVRPSPTIKNKEKCKYWPVCRQGEKCEFVHPTTQCKMFPQCKFGDKCLYIHPNCKFESSCTRKDCPYSHASAAKVVPAAAQVHVCKFFPNCTNAHCTFYHPKICKFGRFCKNQKECPFSHVAKGNLIWRSSV